MTTSLYRSCLTPGRARYSGLGTGLTRVWATRSAPGLDSRPHGLAGLGALPVCCSCPSAPPARVSPGLLQGRADSWPPRASGSFSEAPGSSLSLGQSWCGVSFPGSVDGGHLQPWGHWAEACQQVTWGSEVLMALPCGLCHRRSVSRCSYGLFQCLQPPLKLAFLHCHLEKLRGSHSSQM